MNERMRRQNGDVLRSRASSAWWRLVIVAIAATSITVRAMAQEADAVSDRFMALNIMVSGAHSCGASRADVVKVSDAIAAEFARQYPQVATVMTPAWVEESVFELSGAMTRSNDKPGPFGKPCSHYRQSFDALLAEPTFVARLVGPREQPAPAAEEAPMSLDELKTVLAAQADGVPKGQLAAYSGCWRAGARPSVTTLCFVAGGDEVDVVIEGPKGTRCSYTGGQARPRNDGAFFYAFAPSGRCSNGQATEHVEGYCDQLDGMKCLTSFFSTGNSMLSLADDAELSHYNGEFAYQRLAK